MLVGFLTAQNVKFQLVRAQFYGYERVETELLEACRACIQWPMIVARR